MEWRHTLMKLFARRVLNRPPLRTRACPICGRPVEVEAPTLINTADGSFPSRLEPTTLELRGACSVHGSPPFNKWTVLSEKGELPPLYREDN